VVEGRAHKTRGHRREREDWIVLLRKHHEGYIDWDTYERNRRLIADNAQMKGVMVKGAPRERRSMLRPSALQTMRKKAPRRLLRRWWKGAALLMPRRRSQSRRGPMRILRRSQGRRGGGKRSAACTYSGRGRSSS
jgi:hypothetical protein